MSSEKPQKTFGFILLSGAFLTVLSTVMHPRTTNPWDGSHALHEINSSYTAWMWDHVIMMLAMILWLIGLSSSEMERGEKSEYGQNAGRLFVVSLAIWMIVLCAELTALPYLAKEAEGKGASIAYATWEGHFAFGLFSGYIALALTWIGVSFLSKHLKRDGISRRFYLFGWYGGWVGLIGIILSLLFPEHAIVILPVTSGVPFVWTGLLGWKMIKKEGKKQIKVKN
ncbi:hypothetical protein [Pseudalkalibacillus caeni]|uniref:DUF4386 domain-containing protein n=1 Tax=Exobacillus caeni TaxID=2574798 RepID=A0A5R9EW03_9BACL|nr:hypothetical protein [Pseudalkalibacillus caeni]TLS35227.1 hypothetical protein FCL54_21760 [Pseudalkalibacillus caeni]